MRNPWDEQFYSTDNIELVNDGLNNRPFAQQQFVRQIHESVFHVLAQSGDELKSLLKEERSQGSRDIASISDEPASQTFDHLRNRLAVIDIASSQTTSQEVAPVIDRQVQLEV